MTKKSTPKPSPRPKSLKVERIFDASPETLWSYWTDPEKFAKWFNPAPGKDLVVYEYDVRPGGHVRFDMPQPDGNRNPQEGTFHILKPYREIVSGAPDKSLLIAVKLTPVGKRTRVAVTVTGVPPAYHEGATKGWNAGFDKLVRLLGGGAKSHGFTIERTFKAPLEKVWVMWTTKKGLESWWGPEGFSTKFRKLDLRPGGEFEYAMTATGPEQVEALRAAGIPLTSVGHGTYMEVVSQRRLGIRNVVDFIPGLEPYDRLDTVEFHAVTRETRMVFTSTGMHDEQWQQMAIRGFTSSLDRLERLLDGALVPSKPKHDMELTLPTDREILVRRVLDAPRERVFRAYTDPRAIPEWWGPRSFTTRVDTMDVRPGGAWRFVNVGPDGKEYGFHGVFRAVVPPERLTWTFEFEGVPGHVSLETVTFEEQPGGKTLVTVTARYQTKEDRDGTIQAGMEWGMRESMERLDDLLSKEA